MVGIYFLVCFICFLYYTIFMYLLQTESESGFLTSRESAADLGPDHDESPLCLYEQPLCFTVAAPACMTHHHIH